MTGRSWGVALTSGLAAAALGLAGLLGAVLHSAAQPPERRVGVISVQQHHGPLGRPAPTRARDDQRDVDKEFPKERRPPVRLWRGPTPEKAPPKPRRAMA